MEKRKAFIPVSMRPVINNFVTPLLKKKKKAEGVPVNAYSKSDNVVERK